VIDPKPDGDELVEMGWEWRSRALGTDSMMIGNNIPSFLTDGWELFQTVWNGATVVGIFRRVQYAIKKTP
jgi:hypothetical protein